VIPLLAAAPPLALPAQQRFFATPAPSCYPL